MSTLGSQSFPNEFVAQITPFCQTGKVELWMVLSGFFRKGELKILIQEQEG